MPVCLKASYSDAGLVLNQILTKDHAFPALVIPSFLVLTRFISLPFLFRAKERWEHSGTPGACWYGHLDGGGRRSCLQPGVGFEFLSLPDSLNPLALSLTDVPITYCGVVLFCFLFFNLKNRRQVIQIGKKFGLHSFKRPG